MTTTTTARVRFDDPTCLDGATFECTGFLNRSRTGIATDKADRDDWNGWELPLFNRAQAEALRTAIEATNAEEDFDEYILWGTSIDSARREELIIYSSGIVVEAPEVTGPDGERLWYVDGWCWIEAAP